MPTPWSSIAAASKRSIARVSRPSRTTSKPRRYNIPLEVLKPADYRRQRWKNDGGVTEEIAADAESTPPDWRISIATIERNGPFSDFSGYDRTIVALDGGPVRLRIDALEIDLTEHEPFAFPGESAVVATIGNPPARDLNVMTRRAEYAHDVEIVRQRQVFLPDDDELVFAYVIAGRCTVAEAPCVAGETAYLDGVERFEIVPEAGATICVTRITPR